MRLRKGLIVAGCLAMLPASIARGQTVAGTLSLELGAGASLVAADPPLDGVTPDAVAGLGYSVNDAWRVRVLAGYARWLSAPRAQSVHLLVEADYLIDDLRAPPFVGVGVRHRRLVAQPQPAPATGLYLLVGVALPLPEPWGLSLEARTGRYLDAPVVTTQLLARLSYHFRLLGSEP